MVGDCARRTRDYLIGAAQVVMPYIVRSIEVYEQQTTWSMVLEHNQVVALWRMNPFNAPKITWGNMGEQGVECLSLLKKSGKSAITIDPIRSETIGSFGGNAAWTVSRMGTDTAIMLEIAHTLVKKNLHDKAFPERYTIGYPQFEEYLPGKSDKMKKAAEWASGVCGVSVE